MQRVKRNQRKEWEKTKNEKKKNIYIYMLKNESTFVACESNRTGSNLYGFEFGRLLFHGYVQKSSNFLSGSNRLTSMNPILLSSRASNN